ncbi:MAG: hypothetical protein ICV65_13035 [Flavisolibacter sp.]|nr:hypothetical protein [Flavisolibacter sp.]
MQTSLEVTGTPMKLEAQKETILFRMVQESLHNIIKHAHASEVHVQAVFTNDLFELTISDNGRGFDTTVDNIFGSGLRNIKSRSELIGADLNIISNKESGTRIHIRLPVNH